MQSTKLLRYSSPTVRIRFFKDAIERFPETNTIGGLIKNMHRLEKRRKKNKVAKQSRKRNR